MRRTKVLLSLLFITSLVLANITGVLANRLAEVDDSYTKVLLHMDGADASTTFTDESGKTWTANGNAQIDTAQYVFGGSSGLFDGTGDYISTPDSDDYYFTGDMTVDFRIRVNLSVVSRWVGQWTDGNNGWRLYNVDGTNIRFDIYSGGNAVVQIIVPHGMSVGTWYHIALTRYGNIYTIYKNGTSLGTVTDSDGFANYTGDFIIGQDGYGGINHLNGWIDEFRLSKGIARWTSNFTPPTEPYAPAPTPTPTFTPTETLTPTLTHTPTLTPTATPAPDIVWALPGQPLDDDIRTSIALLLWTNPPADASGPVYAITNVQNNIDHYIVSVLNLENVNPPYDQWNLEQNARWAGSIYVEVDGENYISDYYVPLEPCPQQTVSEDSEQDEWQAEWYSPVLPELAWMDTYTMTLTTSSSATITLDAIVVIDGDDEIIYDDQDEEIGYSAGWIHNNQVGQAYNQTDSYTQTGGATATLVFSGTRIKLVFRKYPGFGEMTYSIAGDNCGYAVEGGGSAYVMFPWEAGKQAAYGQRGVHSGTLNLAVGNKAVDFVGGDGLGASVMSPYAYAAADGTITYVCQDDFNVGVKLEGSNGAFYYLHLAPGNNALHTGATFRAGEMIGKLVYGNFGSSPLSGGQRCSTCPAGANCTCGWACQGSTNYHLHFCFVPQDNYFAIEDCILNTTTQNFVCGLNTYRKGSWLSHAGGGTGSSIPPTSDSNENPVSIPDIGGDNVWSSLLAGITDIVDSLVTSVLPIHTSVSAVSGAEGIPETKEDKYPPKANKYLPGTIYYAADEAIYVVLFWLEILSVGGFISFAIIVITMYLYVNSKTAEFLIAAWRIFKKVFFIA